MMNYLGNKPLPLGPETPLGEILLAETAIRIELPPSQHQLAVDRYEAVRKHVERPDSPFAGRVTIFYPQGSMAIGATIKARKRDEGFDIDIVAELVFPWGMTPQQILDALYDAINGPIGSRYHGKVERQTRCVTVYYEDGMHLDITPSSLLDQNRPRESEIFHAKPGEHPSTFRRLPMNSFGFCNWFQGRTPIDVSFAEGYRTRELAFDARLMKSADVVPVPDHSKDAGGKSVTVVALQLLKRNRNVRYAQRPGRMPPSVMMSYFAGKVAVPGSSISEALGRIVDAILADLEAANAAGRLIDIRNPVCEADRFTDRWPENLAAQRQYIDDLKLFKRQLASLLSDELGLPEKSELLVKMFGEGPARAAVRGYAEVLGSAVKSGNRSIGSTGRVLPVSAVAAAPAIVRPASHTFFGSRWRPKK